MAETEVDPETEASAALMAAREAQEVARKDLDEVSKALWSEINNNPRNMAANNRFHAATVEIGVRALELWLAAAAKDREAARMDRESAQKDREAARLDREAEREAMKAERQRQHDDREQQKADRRTMNRLTFVIALATLGTVAGPCIAARSTARSADTSPAAETSP